MIILGHHIARHNFLYYMAFSTVSAAFTIEKTSSRSRIDDFESPHDKLDIFDALAYCAQFLKS